MHVIPCVDAGAYDRRYAEADKAASVGPDGSGREGLRVLENAHREKGRGVILDLPTQHPLGRLEKKAETLGWHWGHEQFLSSAVGGRGLPAPHSLDGHG